MTDHGDDTYRYENIRLNFSSNVYNHFDHSALFQHLSERMAAVQSYPEPSAQSLECALAERLTLSPDNVMVTNGATEAIYLIAQTFGGSNAIIPQPTFSEYRNAANLFPFSVSRFPSVHWLCNPNNPTGRVMPKEDVVRMIEGNEDTLFVLDHSYECFTDKPVLSAAEAVAYDNVLVIHSMTKDYAIPGLRLGYVTGCKMLMDKLRERRMPWAVNVLAIIAGHYLLQHSSDYKLPLQMLLSERKRVGECLAATGMVEVEPSDTHILLCRLRRGTAAELKERLANEYGILIRDASNFEDLTPSHFRIAVQTEAENNEFLKVI